MTVAGSRPIVRWRFVAWRSTCLITTYRCIVLESDHRQSGYVLESPGVRQANSGVDGR